MEKLSEISNRLIHSVSLQFFRNLYNEINWDNRLIEIKGARGVGKTTLILQKAHELLKKRETILYVSLDSAYFFKNKLVDLADEYFKYGGKYLFIDEVHKYPPKEYALDWSIEIKNIYDSFPGIFIVYSGSSILQLHKSSADLSRRKVSYLLSGLSFREFILYNENINFPKQTLKELFSNHISLSSEITGKIKILPLFKEYLKYGYYPFYKESKENYFEKLHEIINVIVENDIPSVTDINFDTSVKLKKLFSLLAVSVPFTPNMSKLAKQLNIADSRTLLKYLNYLEKAELIKTLGAKVFGNQIFNKPDKIYLDNTNLMYSLDDNMINIGTLRETFVVNQLKNKYSITYPKSGDLFIDNTYTLEIGGKNKTDKQIKELSNAYIAMDNIETGFANKIPVWLFGFLY